MNLSIVVAFFNFLAFVICFFAALKIFSVIKGKKRESINIKYFFYALFFVSVYLFVEALPFFFTKNTYFIFFFTSFFRPFLLIGGMFLTLITINLSKIKMLDSIYVYSSIFVVLLSSVLIIIGISDIGSANFLTGEIEKWMRPDNILIKMGIMMNGVFFSLSLFMAFFFYVRFALREKMNKVALGKAIMMAVGCFMFFVAGILKYVIGIAPGNFILASVAASFLFVMGSVAFVSSVNYKGEKQNIN